MAEPFYKTRLFKALGILFAIIAIGLFLEIYLFAPGGRYNPRLVTYDGKPIYLHDAEAGMSESERAGNSLEYKKQLAANMVREKLIADLALRDGLSRADFIKKIKAGANAEVSEAELLQFMLEGNINRAKLSRAQMQNIKGNLQEHKREMYFNDFMKKALLEAKITWENP